MAKNIEPKLKKIGDYLKLEEDTVFTIPEYQRAYSWGIDNCDKLWQDINDFVESESKDRYFFGTIIINCQDNDTKYGLIDGQQRTTTFLLLLKALLVRINIAIERTASDEDSASLCRGLQERRRRIMGILYKAETEDISDKPDAAKDAEICRRGIILENFSINEQYKTELSTILQATDYASAEARVIKIKYKQKDNRYTNFFRNFKFFYGKISELSDSQLNSIAKSITDNCEVIEIKSWQVEQAITMFNSLNSDGLPLYDSDIISAKLYAEAEKRGKEKEFADLWKQLNNCINELESTRIADINSILMQYMYYIRTVNKETISETGAINVTTPGLRRYFTEINKMPITDPIGMCSDMVKLAKVWKKVSEYPQMKVLLKFNENTKLFLASYFFRFDEDNITEELVEPILECLLRLFSLLELVDVGYSSKYFKTFLFGAEVKLVSKSTTVDAITQDFNEHIRSNWDKETIWAALHDYDGNVLVYLNEFLFAKEKGLSFTLGTKYDIEHIMPYSGNNLQEIRKDAEIDSEEEFYDVVNKLGNKILLEEKINRAIGNEWFRTKVSTKLENKTGYIDSKYPIARALVSKYQSANKPYWKKDDIMSATDKASDRIVRFIFGE
ncbi:DUF262 domain-containing HNH endonuclease family protein [Roseburia rectibacter]|jgi:hypothetical protein|uniref:DUF262 domain-containing protein n=1 Tax=Roseburia rectibacter TaxID=2763062 RepID=UPI00164B6DEC|nr:DUF262 domain-containing protein [Roseburia rectibacter]UMZ00349.1 DUF262 domain-containing HNH endonuclease family protein [Roseburia rectibacter]